MPDRRVVSVPGRHVLLRTHALRQSWGRRDRPRRQADLGAHTTSDIEFANDEGTVLVPYEQRNAWWGGRHYYPSGFNADGVSHPQSILRTHGKSMSRTAVRLHGRMPFNLGLLGRRDPLLQQQKFVGANMRRGR